MTEKNIHIIENYDIFVIIDLGDKMKPIQHFKTITKHKIKVGQLCFRVKLYKQGLLHDLSKYSWPEFYTGAKYYQGTRSPNSAEREEKGYSLAWLHHKGRNKHHWEFWVDMTRNGVTAAKMPNRYILEMFCDRVAASMIYNGDRYTDRDALTYYEGGKHSYIMHPKTREILEELLYYLADHGLDETIRYINEEKDLRNDD